MEKGLDALDNRLKELMTKLEREGEERVKQLKDTKSLTIDSLSQVMQSGDAEFKRTMGRPMTYGEMRAMYG